VTERVTPEILSLPMFPQLTIEQQARVVEAVRSFRGHAAARTEVVETSLTAKAV